MRCSGVFWRLRRGRYLSSDEFECDGQQRPQLLLQRVVKRYNVHFSAGSGDVVHRLC